MIVNLTIHTDNGADVTVERGQYENNSLSGPEVDLRALDALLTLAAAEVRAAYGMAPVGTKGEVWHEGYEAGYQAAIKKSDAA